MALQTECVREVRKAFPNYTVPLDSACRHSEKTGVMRTPKAQEIIDSLNGKDSMTEQEEQELWEEYQHINRAMELISEYYEEKVKEVEKQHEDIRKHFDGLPEGVKAYRLRRCRTDIMQWFADKEFAVFHKLYQGD